MQFSVGLVNPGLGPRAWGLCRLLGGMRPPILVPHFVDISHRLHEIGFPKCAWHHLGDGLFKLNGCALVPVELNLLTFTLAKQG